VFKISGAELAAARGNVCCSHCNALFDALATLSDQLPEEPIGQLDVHARQSSAPQLGSPVFRPKPIVQGSLFFNPDDRQRIGTQPSGPPQFTRLAAQRHGPRNAPWILGSMLLALVLAGQIAWTERASWIDDARVRPWLDSACAMLGCHVPLRRDDALLQLASRDIRPHPSEPGALIISATVHNAADFAQPFPAVSVTLSDLDEKRIAMRRFRPAEYAADSEIRDAGLAAGASASIVFEVADPGRNAVAFEFRFD
ncbi:MAG: DUF3426 domain-containing protein, partial [Dokdonella sp.]